MWRCTLGAELAGTSVGPVFFARGGIVKLGRAFGREGVGSLIWIVARTNPCMPSIRIALF
jgi:hypothetical protein